MRERRKRKVYLYVCVCLYTRLRTHFFCKFAYLCHSFHSCVYLLPHLTFLRYKLFFLRKLPSLRVKRLSTSSVAIAPSISCENISCARNLRDYLIELSESSKTIDRGEDRIYNTKAFLSRASLSTIRLSIIQLVIPVIRPSL